MSEEGGTTPSWNSSGRNLLSSELLSHVTMWLNDSSRQEMALQGNRINSSTVPVLSQKERQSESNEPTFIFLFTTVAIALACFIGNLLVCLLFTRSRNLRRRANTFVVSLAASDILVATLYIPTYIYDTMNNQDTHIRFIVLFITLSSILNHCALTYDRFICIHRPLHYHRVMTQQKVRHILIAIWILPVVNAVIPSFWMFIKGLSQAEKMTIVKYFVLVNILFIFLCSILIFAVYGFLFRVATRHIIAIGKLKAGDLQPIRSENYKLKPNNPNRKRRKNVSKILFAEMRAAKTFLIITILHFICWLPMVYINLCHIFIPDTKRHLLSQLLPVAMHFIMFYGLIVRSSINPFLYALFKAEFRAALHRFIFKRSFSYDETMFAASRWDHSSMSSRRDSLLLQETSRN